MFGAEDGPAVVVVEHVGREGALEVIAVFILQGLTLLLLFVLARLGGHCVGLSLGCAALLLLGGLRLVFRAFGAGGSRCADRMGRNCKIGG